MKPYIKKVQLFSTTCKCDPLSFLNKNIEVFRRRNLYFFLSGKTLSYPLHKNLEEFKRWKLLKEIILVSINRENSPVSCFLNPSNPCIAQLIRASSCDFFMLDILAMICRIVKKLLLVILMWYYNTVTIITTRHRKISKQIISFTTTTLKKQAYLATDLFSEYLQTFLCKL